MESVLPNKEECECENITNGQNRHSNYRGTVKKKQQPPKKKKKKRGTKKSRSSFT